MDAYINQQNKPILPSCTNCINFRKIEGYDDKAGYCNKAPLMFAYTLSKTVFPIVKTFYVCEDHVFQNKETLDKNSKKIPVEDAIKLK